MSNDASLAGTLDGNCGHQSLFSSFTPFIREQSSWMDHGFVVGIFIISTKRLRIIFPIEEMKFLEFRAVTYYQLFELIKISISNNSITRKFDNKIKKYSYQRRFYVSCSFT